MTTIQVHATATFRLPLRWLHAFGPVGLLVVWFLLAAGPAQASLYDDGGTHTISGPDTDVVIANGTTVNVVSGATVIGLDNDPGGHTAISVSGGASVLHVTGGSISGGSGSKAGGFGIFATDGHFDISSGTIVGGYGSGFGPFQGGGAGAYISDFQSVSISGGNFTGGGGDANGNDGLHLSSFAPKSATISGGTFQGGIGHGLGGGTSGFDLHVTGPVTVNVTGGNFVDGFPSAFADNSVGNLSGGSFISRTEAFSSAVVNVSDGQFPGGFALHDTTVANLSGGELGSFVLNNDAMLNANGGNYSSSFTLSDNSVMNLKGGHLLPSVPERFIMGQTSILNVYGTGLSLQPLGGPFWDLQGTLQDGTLIPANTAVLRFDNSVVNLIEVPEPSSVVLTAIGLISMAAWLPRKRQAI